MKMSRDYQSEYNSLYKEYLEYTETVDESIKDQAELNKFYNEYILKYQSKRDYIVDAMKKLVSDAEKNKISLKERPIKYYKIKRGEYTVLDFEFRRTYLSKDDYQKAYDELKNKYAEADDAIKWYESKIEQLKENIKTQTKRAASIFREMLEVYNDAKNNGITIKEKPKKKRSEIMDENLELEERAKTTAQLEKEYWNIAKELKKYEAEYAKLEDEAENIKYKYGKKPTDEKMADKLKILEKQMDKLEPTLNKLADKLEGIESDIEGMGAAMTKTYRPSWRSKESTDLEERALNTEKDYESAYDDLVDEWKKNHAELMKAYSEEKKFSELVDKLEKNEKDINNKMGDLVNKAKKDGFKLNQKAFRSEESTDLESRKKEVINKLTDLEERKNAVLDNLEYRASYKTEEDWQKAMRKISDEVDKVKDEYDKLYHKNEKEIEEFKKKKFAEEKILLDKYDDLLKKKNEIYNFGYKNGWKVKRSFELDNLEYRAKLETEKDYQKELAKFAREGNMYFLTAQAEFQKQQFKLKNLKREAEKVYNEAIKKGFKVSDEVIKSIELWIKWLEL